MYHYVYQITNLLNDMIYVGKRSSKVHPDIDTYFGSGVHLKRAIKKYGKDNFKKEIISIVDSVEEAEELEERIVDAAFIARKDTYNMIVGGQKGTVGLILSEESKSKISESHKGKKHSSNTKSKISEAHKGRKSPTKGKAMSYIQKQKISDANKGRIWINNGKISKMVKPNEINKYISSGFTRGTLL